MIYFYTKISMDIQQEVGLLNAKPADTPLEVSLKLEQSEGGPLQDPSR